jgi:hypothetical protein
MSYRLGVWIWGFALTVWLISVVVALIEPNSSWSQSLQNHDSLAAAVTAVLGIVWSWFLQLDSRRT